MIVWHDLPIWWLTWGLWPTCGMGQLLIGQDRLQFRIPPKNLVTYVNDCQYIHPKSNSREKRPTETYHISELQDRWLLRSLVQSATAAATFFSNLSMTLCSNTNQFLLITHWNIGMGIGMGNHDGIILRLLILRICGIHPVVHTGAFLWAIAAILSQTIHLWGRFIFGSSDGYWDISSSFWDNKHSHLDRLWEVW